MLSHQPSHPARQSLPDPFDREHRADSETRDARHELTKREYEVAQLVAWGLANRHIAERLSLSPRTVEHHVASIFNKMRLRSRSQLAATFARS
jgi:non-specific serine/threonine protein kinase